MRSFPSYTSIRLDPHTTQALSKFVAVAAEVFGRLRVCWAVLQPDSSGNGRPPNDCVEGHEMSTGDLPVLRLESLIFPVEGLWLASFVG